MQYFDNLYKNTFFVKSNRLEIEFLCIFRL